MAWKTINGGRYFYRSVRVGRRVRSEYVGGGVGHLAAELDALEQERKNLERMADRMEREEWDEIDRGLDEISGEARALAERLLTLVGYHQHKRGEWRRRRG